MKEITGRGHTILLSSHILGQLEHLADTFTIIRNGRTALEPLWSHFGARRNGWRFLGAQDFPPAAEHHSFGVLSSFSAATRLGALGQRIDDALYAADLALTPLARQHAVHLHVYRAPA